MTPERWKKIEDIFQEALDYSPIERKSFIRQKVSGDEELQKEVEKLIARYESDESFLESPVWTDSLLLHSNVKKEIASSLEETNLFSTEKSFTGRQIGAYRLTEELGRGGMGVVFLAERADGEFKQKVAVKLIKRGMDTDFILRRFRQERQIAATLNHPNIARLLDGGTTEDDLPYFVMEYVEGRPFFKYAETHNLKLREKLELFLQVCRAIAYAHRKRIVHRDIKPGNILVTDDGEPKLLDFGIAKILDPDLIHESLMPTATQMRLMTPEYASPEQVRGDEITEASDQYSLGVLFYELLTGNRPYKFPSRAPHEIARIICEEMPSEPSSGDFGKRLLENAELSAFDQDFCRKLDRIVLKSLRKNPDERYASVKDFIDDIERFLRNEPVLAESFAGEETSRIERKSVKSSSPADQKSIAVLPFKILNTLSEVKAVDDEFLDVGLADALITRLSGVRRFAVRPTSSVLRFSNADIDSFAAARELAVDFILEGTILRAGNLIRISVQLLDAREKLTVWAERFDEDLIDVLELEDKISARVAESLVPQMSGEERRQLEKRGTDDRQAYEAFLRGRIHWNTYTEAGFRRAHLFYQEAINFDPQYAAAYAAIADYYVWIGVFGSLPSHEAFTAAKRAARRAVEFDDDLSEAYASLGAATLYGEYDWRTGEQYVRRAIDINPHNAVARVWYSHHLNLQQRFGEAQENSRRAAEIDSVSFEPLNELAWDYYFARRFDDALATIAQVIEKFPSFGASYYGLSNFLRIVGRVEESLEASLRSVEMAGDSSTFLYGHAQALAAAGKTTEAENFLDKIKAQMTQRAVSYFQTAVVYCWSGEPEKAVNSLEKSLEDREGMLLYFLIEPAFDRFRDDARFVEFAAKLDFTGLKSWRPEANRPALQTTEDKKPESPANSPSQKSIAVLPFKILDTLAGAESPTDDGGFLGIGLADALITRLSNVRQFLVRPTSSILSYGDRTTDSFAAGANLNVQFVLDGSIIKTESRIRVSVQLLNVAEQITIWAERFDESLTDVLELEDAISVKVADALVPHLTGEERRRLEKRGTDSPQAHESYLRGRYHWNLFSEEGFRQAIAFYEKAVTHDPNYAAAHASIAEYYVWLGIYGVIHPAKAYEAAKRAAHRAVELDPNAAEAYAALGMAQIYADHDWQRGEQNMIHALKLNEANAAAHLWRAYPLLATSRFDEGIRHLKRAIELDPTSFAAQVLAYAYYFARRFDDALDEIRRILAQIPGNAYIYSLETSIYRILGRRDEALTAAQRVIEVSNDSPFFAAVYAQTLAATGNRAEAERIAAQLEERSRTTDEYISFYMIAIIYGFLGDKERTFAALDRAFATHDALIIWIDVDHLFDELLRDDPRFDELLRKINFPASKTIHQKPTERRTLIKDFKVKPNSSATSAQKSIAVLPFKILDTLSEARDTEGEFLGIGLADALITRLSNVRQFVVRPTSSVIRFNNPETDSFVAARELNVGFILDGNILKTDKRIRVSVQLIDVARRSTVWAERFEEDLIDVFALEDSISKRVAESLVPQLSTDEAQNLAKRGTVNAAAYEAYLHGRFYWNTFTEEGFRQAIFFYNKAVELDPDYALAFAAIADYYIWLGIYGVVPPDDCYPPAKAAALKAIGLDDKLAEAYGALGLARLYGDYDWKQSEKDILRAIELNPNNAVTHLWYSHNLFTQGRFAEGQPHVERAVELDPLAFQNHNTLAWSYFLTRRFDDALRKSEDVIERFPAISHSYFSKAHYLNRVGRSDEAMIEMKRAMELSDDSLFTIYGLAATLAAAGKRRETIELIEKTEAESPSKYFSYYQVSLSYAYLKDNDKAFEYLERAFVNRESLLVWIGVEPTLDPLRDDSRYLEFLRKINHPTLQTIYKNARGEKTLIQDFGQSDSNQKQTADSPQATETRRIKSESDAKLVKYALAAIALIVLGYGLFHIISNSTFNVSDAPPGELWKNSFAALNLKRLTTSGKARQAVLSPDGGNVAYILEDGGRQSLWIRSTDADNARQLVAPDAISYTELKFSPAGNYIYYIASRAPARTLYRVSVNGGVPEKISENVFNLFAFAPDGRRIAYENRNSDNNQFSLFVAELDENARIKSARTLVVLEMPNYFPGGIAFSPDGKKIVYPRSVIENNKEVLNLFVYDLTKNTNERLGDKNFDRINATGWRNYGGEIVISARESDSPVYQLWVVAYPSGETSRLTNDFTSYFGVSLTADSATLATTKMELISNIWTSEITESGVNFQSKVKQITDGAARQDGSSGLSWTKDGRILYATGAGAERGIALMNADGTNKRPISTGALEPRFPTLTSDNRFLVYADKKGQELNIWRFDMTAGTPIQVSSRYAVTPAISPDNRSMVYAVLSDPSSNRLVIHRQPLEGGEETKLTSETSVRPVVSPDGRFVACNYAGDETNKIWQIAVLPMEPEAAPKFIQPYKNNFFVSPQERPLAWSPDGRFLYFLNNADNNIANIFRVAVEGNSSPVQVTHFTSGEIFDFALAPDGKSFALARGATSSDIVIFNKPR